MLMISHKILPSYTVGLCDVDYVSATGIVFPSTVYIDMNRLLCIIIRCLYNYVKLQR
jgi:hypothetical protein